MKLSGITISEIEVNFTRCLQYLIDYNIPVTLCAELRETPEWKAKEADYETRKAAGKVMPYDEYIRRNPTIYEIRRCQIGKKAMPNAS